MSARRRAILVSLGLCLGGCLDLGGSWDPTSATTITASSTSTGTTTTGTTGTTGTSTSTGMTSTTAATESTGCGFLGCEDMPKHPIECDLWEQDCPEGEKCIPYNNEGKPGWDAIKCFPVDRAPSAVGEPCMAEDPGLSTGDNCEANAVCWMVDPDTGIGLCMALCAGTSDAPECAPGYYCQIFGDSVEVICRPYCDPLVQDCPGEDLCLPVNDGFRCILDASGEVGAYGDPCEYANACDPGLVCQNPEYVPDCKAGGCCSPFCDTSKPNTCPGDGQECIPWYEEGEAPPGYETVGVCGVPQP